MMGRLHILSITLLFVLDALFAQDKTFTATSVIRIIGKDEQEETRNGYLKCEVTDPAVGTNYYMSWYDPNGQYVPFQGETNSSRRLFASRDSNTNSISLNLMPVSELDAGLYTCTAMINGQLRNETFRITTYRDITFSNCPLEQKIISGKTQETVSCSASAGGINLTTYWKRQDQSSQIQAGGNKYAITSAGLIIYNVSEADEMVYELHAKYDKTFAWEYRSIAVKVLKKPPAPGVSVDYFTARTIRLGITVPSVRGPPVSKFKIRYKVQGSNEDPITAEAPVATEWINYVDDQLLPRNYITLYDLAAKTNYIITVTAVNDVGESAPYEFTQTTRPNSVPQAVVITSPFPDSRSPTSFLLMWNKPDDGGSELQKYILNYREVEIIPNRTPYELSKPLSRFFNVDDIPPSAVRYQLSSLLPGAYYQVEVQAVNTQGTSPPSSYIFKTKDGKPPSPSVSVDQFTARTIRIGLTVPNVRGPPVSKFIVRYKVQGSNENPMTAEATVEWSTYVDDQFAPLTYITLYDLAVKTNYIITVTAVNDVGESAPYEFTQTTRPYSVPPQTVVITSPFPDSMSSTSFLLIWNKPDDGGSEIQKYILSYREVEIIPNRTQYELFKPLSGFIIVDDIPPSAVRYQLSSLIPGTYYQVEVHAINTQGSSPPSSYIFKTKEGTSARLVEVYGNPTGSGILEVLYDGQWGTVCDDSFDYRDADVFCRRLGFKKSSHFTSGHSYVPTTSDLIVYPIWMDELSCMGNESDVSECDFSGWGWHDCQHSEDIMLFCTNDSTTTTESYWRQTSLEISSPTINPQHYRWYNTHRWYYTSSVSTRTTSPWYPTTSSDSLENFTSSSCTSSGWNIQVDMYRLRQMYPNARESDIYLGANSCTGYSNGYTLVFQHGIKDCLTSETVTPNSTVYRNRLFYAMPDPQYKFIIRDYNWTVEVVCDVMINETASSHISHNTIEPLVSGHVQGTSHYTITMRFYSDPNFQYEIPGNPLHVTVGSDVYVKAYTDAADWGIKMIVRSCYTKPDPYASDSLNYYIIRDGCEADVNTHYISQSSHETKFMFRDFEYTSNHVGLYLYCDATFCETSDYSYQCQQSCDPRGKRDAESRPRLTETVREKIIHTRK